MKDPKDKQALVDAAMKDIRSRFGDEAIMTLDSKPAVDVEAIPTGSLGLDAALGIGGLPRGRIIEIFGTEASGKTTLALHIVAQAQKLGGVCAYVDVEQALDASYADRIGVTTKNLLISQPNGGEEALQIVDSLVRSKALDVVIVDSVAALTPKSEVEGQIGDAQIGAQARLMSQAMRMLTASIAKTNTLVVFINQVRTNIQATGYGQNPEVTAGGRALKFYASVRIDVRRIAHIKKGETVIGGNIKAKVVKNKVGVPFKQVEYDIIYGEGISREAEILVMGEKCGVVTRAGSSYRYGDESLGRGYDAARQYLRENPKIAEEIITKIREKL